MITPGDKGRDVREHSCGNFSYKGTVDSTAPLGSGATFTKTGARCFGSSAAERRGDKKIFFLIFAACENEVDPGRKE